MSSGTARRTSPVGTEHENRLFGFAYRGRFGTTGLPCGSGADGEREASP